jgi:hypothetical protein
VLDHNALFKDEVLRTGAVGAEFQPTRWNGGAIQLWGGRHGLAGTAEHDRNFRQ